MAQINPTSTTFIGAAALTTANANDFLAVRLSNASGVSADGQATVTLSQGHSTEHYDSIIGSYIGNPGHEGNPVSVNVRGLLIIQVNAEVVQAHIGRGLISSTTAGVAEVGPAISNSGTAKVGFGSIVGGFSEGGKFYAYVWAG